jgi:uncharacterized MnhB-related membrane protein
MINVLVAILIVLAGIALTVRDLLAAVVVLSVFSLISCLLFFLLSAPDVALTEAAVGTGIGSVVFIWAVFRTQRRGASAK